MADAALRILVIDDNALRASVIEEGLREAGLFDVRVITDMRELLRQIVDMSLVTPRFWSEGPLPGTSGSGW